MTDNGRGHLRELAADAQKGPWYLTRDRQGDLHVLTDAYEHLGSCSVAGDNIVMDLATAKYIAAVSPDVLVALLDLLSDDELRQEDLRDARNEIIALRAKLDDARVPPAILDKLIDCVMASDEWANQASQDALTWLCKQRKEMSDGED